MIESGQVVRAKRDIMCPGVGTIPKGSIGWILVVKHLYDDECEYHVTFAAVPHPTRPGNYWVLSGDSLEELKDG